VAASVLAGRPAAGQTFAWGGSLGGNWSTPGNWTPAGPPTSGVNTALSFGATGNAVMTDDLAGTFSLNSLTFSAAAPAYTLGGNPLAFQTNSGNAFPTITQNSSNAVTINNNMSVAGLVVQGSGTGTVTLNGAISGSGFLAVQPAAATVVVLGGGSNTYTGTGYSVATAVYGGTLQLGNGNAIPTGTNVLVATGATFNTAGLSNTAFTAIGTLYLGGFGYGGGTFRVPTGGLDYYLNKLNMTGGTVDFTGTNNFWLHFTGAGAGITTNASGTTATWVGAPNSRIQNDTAAPLTITVASGTTPSGIDLDAGITLSGGGTNPNFTLAGGGTMRLTSLANTANITVASGFLRVDDAASNGGVGALGTGTITLAYNGGPSAVLLYGGPSAASAKPITLAGTLGGQISVLSGGVTWTLNGVISQSVPGSALYVGSGFASSTLVLNGTNTYSGPTTVVVGGILAIPTIANGGVPSPIGSSSSAPANLLLGGLNYGTLLLTGTNPAYSTDRGITVGGDPSGGSPLTGGFVGVQNATTNLTVSGQIIGFVYNPQSTGNLIKTGPGTLTLTNTTNSYAAAGLGGTYVQGGTLAVGAAGAVIPAGSGVVVSQGATFQLGFTSGNNSAAPVGTITLNGGTLAAPSGGPGYSLNQLVTGPAGGTVNLSASTAEIFFTGAGSAIVVNGNSTFTGAGAFLSSSGSGATTIAVAPNVTLTNNIPLATGGSGYQVTGGGTLYMTTAPNGFILPLTVVQGRVRVDDLSVTGTGGTVLGVPGQFTLNGGALQYSGGNQATAFPITLGPAGGTLEVSNPAATLTLTGAVTGLGGLTKAGPGTLVLGNTGNSFNGLTVNAGVVQTAADNALGVGPVTVNPSGTLLYTASTTTGRTFTLFGSTLRVPDGVALTLDGATVNGGVLHSSGAGSFGVGAGGATLNGVTMYNGTVLNQALGPVAPPTSPLARRAFPRLLCAGANLGSSRIASLYAAMAPPTSPLSYRASPRL
jgi:fibronectin-binding autotransporter adhesin